MININREKVVARCWPVLCKIDNEHEKTESGFDMAVAIEELVRLKQYFHKNGMHGYGGMIHSMLTKIGYCGLDRDACCASILKICHDDSNYYAFKNRKVGGMRNDATPETKES